MTSYAMPEHERLLEFLADAVSGGLPGDRWHEFEELQGPAAEERLTMELAAAAAAITFLTASEHRVRLPASLRRAIEADVPCIVASPKTAPIPGPSAAPRPERGAVVARLGWSGWAGWFVAAAALTLAVLGWWPRLMNTGQAPDPATLASLPGTVEREWAAWAPKPVTEDPQVEAVAWADHVKGRLVWNSQRQAGFMIFNGMKPNDPATSQYQLWIIDKYQAYPIDGGVFNISSDGEAVVPVTAKIKVNDPVAFAVTIEPPGGVVVSSQHKRVVVAPVGP